MFLYLILVWTIKYKSKICFVHYTCWLLSKGMKYFSFGIPSFDVQVYGKCPAIPTTLGKSSFGSECSSSAPVFVWMGNGQEFSVHCLLWQSYFSSVEFLCWRKNQMRDTESEYKLVFIWVQKIWILFKPVYLVFMIS